MLRRYAYIAGGLLYLLSVLIGGYLFFKYEGSFSIGSRYFYAYTFIPFVVLVAHLGGGIWLLWKPERAAPWVCAVEAFMLIWVLSGSLMFWATFRWALLLEIPRAAFAAVVIYYLWFPLRIDRLVVITGTGAGVVLGLAWALSLRPPAAGAEPLAKGPGTFVVWNRPVGNLTSSSPVWQKGLKLAGGAEAIVRPTPSAAEIVMGDVGLSVQPLLSLKRISMDNFWASRLNGVGMVFQLGTDAVDWPEDGSTCTYVRYNRPRLVQSWMAEATALKVYSRELMSADWYTRVDPAGDAVDIVALTHLRDDVCVNATSLFETVLRPFTGQTVLVPGIGRFTLDQTTAEGRSARMLNLQKGRAVLYECDAEMVSPFDEVGRTEHFDDYIVIEGLKVFIDINVIGSGNQVFYFPAYYA